ncbi:integrase [Methanocella arvoryzae MRE50]|uniref:Integrase n=1 Tax=Methanocella arvoryzae (strain DSM 22066 / NBRC 105507 / MRE50) TaxID=351160 RepID=Q0W2T4_METAR|nr:integrase [Methanocella arvoryzae MRE50]
MNQESKQRTERKRISFGTIQQAQIAVNKPLDKYATLERLENYLIYTKRYSKVNIKAVMDSATYLLRYYDLSKIDAEKAQEIEEHQREKGMKSRTIVRRLHTLELISEAIGQPVKIKKPKVVKETKVGLTLLECRALMQSANSIRDRAIISLMLCTGARAKEIVAANVDDIDLKQRFFYIRAHSPDEIVKNYREHKAILTKDAARYIQEWLDIRPEVDEKALFLNTWAERLTKSGLHKIVVSTAKRAGIEKRCYSHLLRAACATNMLRSGISLNDVAAQLNHRSILSTMVYLTSDTETLRDSIDKRFIL